MKLIKYLMAAMAVCTMALTQQASAQDKGLSDHREALCHSGRLGNIAHPCERSDAQATIGKLFDLLERQQIDVNETAGLYDIQAQ